MLNFPNSPALGDTYILNDKSWRWDGVAWTLNKGTVAISYITVSGGPITIANLAANDLLSFNGTNWTNLPASNVGDGGNF